MSLPSVIIPRYFFFVRYDTTAPLPTPPPPDSLTPTYSGKYFSDPDTEPGDLEDSKGGSCTRLREDEDAVDNESGIGLEFINPKNNNEKPKRKSSADGSETIV